ncbi:hypothetical protein ABZT06_44430 [Streptomyces sp. NPDC005483]|uniref:hypothetical protein n=1 Tax=Streptomyces sp. NPDC005483 TaxID=3154882 RepID=UPI0033B51BA3
MDQTTTSYYQLPDGGLRTVTTSEGVDVSVPDGAMGVSAEEYEAALAAIEEQRARDEAERQAAQEAEERTAYIALAALLPDAVARRLSGYTGGVLDSD